MELVLWTHILVVNGTLYTVYTRHKLFGDRAFSVHVGILSPAESEQAMEI